LRINYEVFESKINAKINVSEGDTSLTLTNDNIWNLQNFFLMNPPKLGNSEAQERALQSRIFYPGAGNSPEFSILND